MTDSQDTNKQQQERKTSYEELERIADDLQELCDKQAIRLGKLEAQQQEPVAVVSGYYGGQCVVLPTNPAMLFNNGTAFYTSPQPSKPCEWQQEDSEHMPDTWRSDCGVLWTFTDGGPIENDMRHCCGCGAKLKERNT